MKWLDMFNNWDKWVSRRFQKVPSPLVFRVWAGALMTRLGVIDRVCVFGLPLQVKLRCRKGIPSSLRAKAWQLLSNSKQLLDENPGKFEVRMAAPHVLSHRNA